MNFVGDLFLKCYKDVKVVSATESISEGAEGIILESVLEGMAEYYSADLAEKVSRGMTENALKARFNGGQIPLGFTIDDEHHYQIAPEKAPLVIEMFRRYAGGESITDIVEEEKITLSIKLEEAKKPKITKDFILFTLHKFRNLDLRFEKNKERLIDGLVKAIFVYDDYIKLILTFDDKPINIPTTDEIEYMANSSDIQSSASPTKERGSFVILSLLFMKLKESNPAICER